MAANATLAAVSNALSQTYESQIVRQINREAATLRFLPKKFGAGKNVAWDTEFDGALAASYADGADVADGDFGVDDNLPATLAWGLYRAPFRATGLAIAAAGSSHSPDTLKNLFEEKMFGAVSKLGSVVNTALFTGTGANSILGLLAANGPLDSVGTYAGIDRAVQTGWAGNKLANGGTPRAVSFDLLRAMIRSIFTRQGGYPDILICDPLTFDRIAALFDTNRRWMDSVTTAAGEIKLRGGERALDFDGIPIMRDKDCTAGNVVAINTQHVEVRFLPTYPSQAASGPNGTFEIHDDMGRVSGLPARIEMLGKTGDTEKAYAKVYVQVRNNRPNSCGWLTDLLTS